MQSRVWGRLGRRELGLFNLSMLRSLRAPVRWLSSRPKGGLFARLEANASAGRIALASATAGKTTYAELLAGARAVRDRVTSDPAFKKGNRVAFLARPGFDFVRTLVGVWQAGGVAVPLCVSHPPEELRYAVVESDACTVATSGDDFAATLEPIAQCEGRSFFRLEDIAPCPQPNSPAGDLALDAGDAALIIFTSGTTGKPKGVVLTHGNLQAHSEALVEAWGWTPADRILHILPLHHLHGLGNKLLCALWSGASVDFCPSSPREVWSRLGRAKEDGLTLFMAVPTNYALLLREVERAPPGSELIRAGAEGARSLRLMVSGSMALPTPVLERWRALTGHTLLERYGMTELGMALSNPLEGDRVVGAVGRPLPGVEVELRDPTSGEPVAAGDEQGGELLVRGPGVFREYFGRADETADAFAPGGWFRTGDHASCDVNGVYRILGRASVDVIKTAGYKISALEVERILLAHEHVDEVAVVGIESEAFGQRVAAVVVASEAPHDPGRSREEEERTLLSLLREDCAGQLAAYKLPTAIKVVTEIPKNPMGKINKKSLAKSLVWDVKS
jgi:malonyl-CoA/methylmalonyl-CoA synthetase